MDPLNFSGPVFLLWYMVAFGVCLIATKKLDAKLRLPENLPDKKIKLDAYEIAYLRGGEQQVVDTAVANLTVQEVLTVGNVTTRFYRKGSLPDSASPVEKAVFEAADSTETIVPSASRQVAAGRSMFGIRNYSKIHAQSVRGHLERLQLVMRREQEFVVRSITFVLLMSAPLLIALPKICVGLERSKPVGFLMMLLIGSFVFSVWYAYIRENLRTIAGDRLLEKLRDSNKTLLYASKSDAKLSSANLTLAYALWGASALEGVAGLSTLTYMLKRPNANYGSGGSCGSSGSSCGSSCGGGCGGGGCGGCGG